MLCECVSCVQMLVGFRGGGTPEPSLLEPVGRPLAYPIVGAAVAVAVVALVTVLVTLQKRQ